ncbi:MAG: hypothetical protein B7Z80_25320, partial [Rhodospirillales bacterium 20-64-7]
MLKPTTKTGSAVANRADVAKIPTRITKAAIIMMALDAERSQRILAEASRHAAPDVIIASSTSGLMPSDLQRDMVAPEPP